MVNGVKFVCDGLLLLDQSINHSINQFLNVAKIAIAIAEVHDSVAQ